MVIIYIVRTGQDKQYYVQDLWAPNIITKMREGVELRIMIFVLRAWRRPIVAA